MHFRDDGAVPALVQAHGALVSDRLLPLFRRAFSLGAELLTSPFAGSAAVSAAGRAHERPRPHSPGGGDGPSAFGHEGQAPLAKDFKAQKGEKSKSGSVGRPVRPIPTEVELHPVHAGLLLVRQRCFGRLFGGLGGRLPLHLRGDGRAFNKKELSTGIGQTSIVHPPSCLSIRLSIRFLQPSVMALYSVVRWFLSCRIVCRIYGFYLWRVYLAQLVNIPHLHSKCFLSIVHVPIHPCI